MSFYLDLNLSSFKTVFLCGDHNILVYSNGASLHLILSSAWLIKFTNSFTFYLGLFY